MYIWHIVSLCLVLFVSGAYSDTEMKLLSIFNNGNSYPAIYSKLPAKDVESRLDIMENVIYQLKKENIDQREGMHQLKIQNENQYEEILQFKKEINYQKEAIRQLQNENNIQKEDIRQLKDANKNLEEDIHETKSVLDCLIIDCAHLNRSTNRPDGMGTRMKRQSNADGDTSSGSWAKLEISDRVIGYMDYDSYTVKIYDHASNKDVNMKNEEKKYYFEPIGQLDHRSAKSVFNNISKKSEMTFNVNMWSDSIRNAVHEFIADDLKLGPVNINLVRVLPMDRVILFNEVGSSQHFEIEQNWINYKSDKFLKFKYICDQLQECEDLAMQMKNNPEQFHFKMRFSLASQKSETSTTKINIENIINGGMMNELQQKFPNQDTILITANGKKQLLKESSESVIIQTIDDSQVPSKNSQSEIYRRLENMIQFSRATIQKDDEKAWENNIFWNQDNYRPDMSARTVNDIYNKSDAENQKKLASAFTDTNKGEGGFASGFKVFSASAKISTDVSREGSNSTDSLDKFLNDVRDRVEWDGAKFVPKQMELYAVNMARLKNKQGFEDTDVKISYTTSMLTIDVRHDSTFDQKTSSELFELKNKISGLTATFNSSLANLKVDFQKEMQNLEHVKRKGQSSRIPPSSCQQLSEMGHYLDGLYAIKDNATKKIQAVYCQFETSPVSEELIGHVDVKTETVHFYVQRNSDFSARDAVIPFELARLNEGVAFNLTSGTFTAPSPGIYHFYLSAVKDTSATYLDIDLQVNGANVGTAYTSQGATGSYEAVSLSASLRLAKGDRVNLYKGGGVLYDDNRQLTVNLYDVGIGELVDQYHFTHFTGWLVEEELM